MARVSTIPNTAFGRTTRPASNSSVARFTVASSASSSAMRLLASRSCTDSAVGVPANSPRSIRSWRTHLNTVAGATHETLNYLLRQRLSYSIGFTLPDCFTAKLALIPRRAWTPAYDSDGDIRDGAWVAEVTGLLDLRSWPPGMRVIIRKERPHPGVESQRVAASVRLHRRLETLAVCGMAITWLAVGQIFLVFDLAG